MAWRFPGGAHVLHAQQVPRLLRCPPAGVNRFGYRPVGMEWDL